MYSYLNNNTKWTFKFWVRLKKSTSFSQSCRSDKAVVLCFSLVSCGGGKVWNCWLALPWVFVLKHCRTSVSVRDWRVVRMLFTPVLPNFSSLMEVSVELVSTCPDRRHASVGQGFPRASQTHAITRFRLQEMEILGATERENMIMLKKSLMASAV